MTAPAPARLSLAWRVTAGCLLVAVVAVAVAALVSVRLVTQTARQTTVDVLAGQADVVAAQFGTGGLGTEGARQVTAVLHDQGIELVALNAPATDPVVREVLRRAGVTEAPAVERAAAVRYMGETWIVEARPTASGGLALVRSTELGPLGTRVFRRNITFALLSGMAAAVAVGGVVGGLIARPLRRSAAAAHDLRAGRRDVRVPVGGPREVAEVAGAVNALADALSRSERRQQEFLLAVSHELRTPLTAVRGFAESLADGVVTGADVPAAGRTILREAQRLDRLVTDLRELARLEADDFRLDPSTVELTALVADAAAVWRARCAETGAELRTELPPVPVLVRADPRRLRQVLDGLAENALRLVPAGAPLVLAVLPGGVLEVRDGGPGLAPEDYAVVFQRGALHERYRGHRPVGTGGVGLALAHGLVTRMGGTIAAGPAPEGGAAFTVGLPLAEVPASPRTARPASSA